MTDAQGGFRFDADTAAYNAKMEESKRKSHDVGESFVHGFSQAVPLLGQLATGMGVLEVAVEGVKKGWEQWLERLQAAEKTSKQLVERLAGVAGGAGVLGQYPQLKRGIEDAAGPLTVEQRVSAFGKFAGANPDMAAEHGVEAVQQAQKAALVLGPDGVDRFVHALGIAMRSGLDQKTAGNVALTAAQAGDSGVEALDKLFASYLERFGATGGPNFLEYAKNAGADDFGKRGIIGGTAFQSGLRRGVTLDGESAAAGGVDEELSRSQHIAGLTSGADVANQRSLGRRARALKDLDELDEARRKLGRNYWDVIDERRRTTDPWARAGGANVFERAFSSDEDLEKMVDRMASAIEEATRRANEEHGAVKFRSEAHEEREK